MDANASRFHLLLGVADWSSGTDIKGRGLDVLWHGDHATRATVDLAWDATRHELTLRPQMFRFIAAPSDSAPRIADRRGAGCDRFGNVYSIAADERAVLVYSCGSRATSRFWSASDPPHCAEIPNRGGFADAQLVAPQPIGRLRGLAVTEDQYLVVGTLDPAGILVFDLYGSGPPRQFVWPAAVPFAPFDMAARSGGGVCILDCDPTAPELGTRYWSLDRHFSIVAADQPSLALEIEHEDVFQPADGGPIRSTPAVAFPLGISLADASPVETLGAIAIEALSDDSVLILERDDARQRSRMHRYRGGVPLGDPIDLAMVRSELIEENFAPVAHDFAFAADPMQTANQPRGRLYVVGSEGNQTFAFDVVDENDTLQVDPVAEYHPMRLFGGKALVTGCGAPQYDVEDRWVPLIAQRRPRYVQEAAYVTPSFDGREPDCVWHRLLIDACLPPGAELTVWSRAGNDESALSALPWQAEPMPYRRGDGSELPLQHTPMARQGEPPGSARPRAPSDAAGTWELLFQRARGSHLQIKLRLGGDGRVSPRLRALRAYYPRFSYLEHYLPAVYREDAESASFLDRLLANFEGFYTAAEDRIAAVQLLFDADTVPREALDWLASWFEMALDPAWDERRRRLFIKYAMQFFQWRGTVRGIRTALLLALSPCVDESLFGAVPERESGGGIAIVEKFRLRTAPAVALGDPTEETGVALVQQSARWRPQLGADELRRRYLAFVAQLGADFAGSSEFPLRAPADATLAQQWSDFCRQVLGFVPAATDAQTALWRDFLERRYRRVDALNDAYRLASAARAPAFDALVLPRNLPADGAPLRDWYDFESVVLATRALAHQFRVLLPMPADDPGGEQQRQRIALASRVLDLEKPAHTVFEVKSYWALFRLDEVRLGEDTLIDLGSRSPELLSKMLLGHGYLAGSYLVARPPHDTRERQVLGRDRLANRPTPLQEMPQ